jgi:signal transduction histidine kinase
MSALRIFQEAVSNVLQHAEASTIRVSTGCVADDRGRPGVFVEIRDDGRGLRQAAPPFEGPDPKSAASSTPAAASNGFGMRNMARRAAELGGSITVTDEAPGTRVLLWLPLARPRDRAEEAGG